MTTVAAVVAPISQTSWALSAAAWPKRNLSIPLLSPVGKRWIIVTMQMPTAKNVASTIPSAASSFSRVVRVIQPTAIVPSNPANVAPIRIASGSLVMFQRNPSATPGSTACESVSPTSAILRTTMKLPSSPQLNREENRSDERVAEGGIAKGKKARSLDEDTCFNDVTDPRRDRRSLANQQSNDRERGDETTLHSPRLRTSWTTSERIVRRPP